MYDNHNLSKTEFGMRNYIKKYIFPSSRKKIINIRTILTTNHNINRN